MPTMPEPRFISGERLGRLLCGRDAVDALETGFSGPSRARMEEAPRVVLEHPSGEFLVMPATGLEGAGAKLISVVPDNVDRGMPLINGVYVLFARETLLPETLIDGGALTRLRTAAVSALAARHLAPPGSRRLVVFGAGIQAEAHIGVISEVLPIDEVTVVARSPRSARVVDLLARIRERGIDARLGRPDDVGRADVVCTCTPSRTPVFEGRLVKPGALVCAIGAYRPDLRELDFDLLGRALIVVETRESALKEAGDLIQALDAGVLVGPGFAHEIGELLAGTVTRRSAEQVCVFKSVGIPIEDLIVARAAADRLGDDPSVTDN